MMTMMMMTMIMMRMMRMRVTTIMVTMTIIDVDEDQTCLVSLPGVGRTPKPWLTRVVRKVVCLK